MSRVTIVDDSSDDRDILERWLIASGHEVRSFAAGIKALSSVINDRPDILITDLKMPDMDGFSLLEAIRAYHRLQNLPIIVWTGVTDPDTLSRARGLRVNSILTKASAGLDDIAAAIRSAVPNPGSSPTAAGA